MIIDPAIGNDYNLAEHTSDFIPTAIITAKRLELAEPVVSLYDTMHIAQADFADFGQITWRYIGPSSAFGSYTDADGRHTHIAIANLFYMHADRRHEIEDWVNATPTSD